MLDTQGFHTYLLLVFPHLIEAYYAAVCGLSLKEMNKLEVTQPQRSLYIVGCASFDPHRIWLIDVLGAGNPQYLFLNW